MNFCIDDSWLRASQAVAPPLKPCPRPDRSPRASEATVRLLKSQHVATCRSMIVLPKRWIIFGWLGRCLSDEAFELGEDLLDRIEIRRVFGQEEETRACGLDRVSHGFSLVRLRLSSTTMSLRLRVGARNCSTEARNPLAVDLTETDAKHLIGIGRQAGGELLVLDLPARPLLGRDRERSAQCVHGV